MDKNTDQRRRRTQRSEPIDTTTVYEGDGEAIRSVPATRETRRPAVVKARQYNQPLGRSEELQERLRYGATGERKFTQPVEDTTVYDDFDEREYRRAPKPPRKRRKDPHRGLWLAVCILCVVCMAGIGVLMAPQLLGITIPGVPGIAFVDGSIILLDAEDYELYRTYRQYMDTEAILPGVYIDGVHVGGMTRRQAEDAVWQVSASGGGSFAITVNVGNGAWLIDSTQVPMTRNVTDVVEMAWACGRQNTTQIRSSRITPFQERLNTALKMRSEPVTFSTELTYDKDGIRALTDNIAAYVNREPVNATIQSFNFTSKTFTFGSDSPGAYIDPEELYSQVTGRLDRGVYYDTITVVPEKILAPVTKAELMNSFRLVSSYTTETTSNRNRNTNIDLSAKAINGTTVLPGETFSFNQATGQRSSEKGYLPAAAIAGGQSVDEVGGGVCQTSSTLFNAVARANLEIVDRSPHAWPSNYVEKGLDATVNWPNLDFKFRNNTEWPIFIVSYYKNRKVTVEIYGMYLGDGISIELEGEVIRTTKAPREIKYVQNPEMEYGTQKQTITARDGYEVVTYQVWYKNGKEYDRRQLCRSTYKMYQATIEYN